MDVLVVVVELVDMKSFGLSCKDDKNDCRVKETTG